MKYTPIESFLIGAGKVLDMFPRRKELKDYLPSYSGVEGFEQDKKAFSEDWKNIGNDLEKALGK